MDRMWTCLDFSLHALGTQVVPGGFRRGAGSCWWRCQDMNLESAHLHGEHVNLSVRSQLYDEGHCKFKESTRCPSLCRKRHIIIFTTVWFIPCIMHRADASHLLLFPSCRNNTVNTFRASWMTKWWKIGVFSINCRGNWDFDEDAEMSTHKTGVSL